MKNKPYLRSILGGTDFRCLSLIEKIGAPDKPSGVGRADANPKLLLHDT